MQPISPLRIQRELEELCNAHDQIKTFRYGVFLDIVSQESIEYPLAHAYIRQAPTTNNSTALVIELSIMDQPNKKTEEDLIYVESNTNQTWLDIFNVIQYSERWQAMGIVDTTVTALAFRRKGADWVAGWGGNITFTIEGGAGFCEAPITGYDFDEQPDVVVLDVAFNGLFSAAQGTLPELTITSASEGTYTSISDDGSSGDITINHNGAGFAPFSSPLVLAIGDTLEVTRTISTGIGFYQLLGTF